jgi:hypothetical protein
MSALLDWGLHDQRIESEQRYGLMAPAFVTPSGAISTRAPGTGRDHFPEQQCRAVLRVMKIGIPDIDDREQDIDGWVRRRPWRTFHQVAMFSR